MNLPSYLFGLLAGVLLTVAWRSFSTIGKAYPHYTSTYCIHGNHADCRMTCKTCKAPCLCKCHRFNKT